MALLGVTGKQERPGDMIGNDREKLRQGWPHTG